MLVKLVHADKIREILEYNSPPRLRVEVKETGIKQQIIMDLVGYITDPQKYLVDDSGGALCNLILGDFLTECGEDIETDDLSKRIGKHTDRIHDFVKVLEMRRPKLTSVYQDILFLTVNSITKGDYTDIRMKLNEPDDYKMVIVIDSAFG